MQGPQMARDQKKFGNRCSEVTSDRDVTVQAAWLFLQTDLTIPSRINVQDAATLTDNEKTKRSACCFLK